MAVLDAAQQCACVLDAQGTIVAINPTWRALVATNDSLRSFTEGTAFLNACGRLPDSRDSATLTEEVGQLLSGRCESVARNLMCRSTAGRSWFEMRIRSMPGGGAGFVATCQAFTAQRRAESSLQRYRTAHRNGRLRTVQHALLAQFGQFALENPLAGDL